MPSEKRTEQILGQVDWQDQRCQEQHWAEKTAQIPYSVRGEDEFEALLREWCAWANERGLDTLSIFSSDGSPGYALLRSLASAVEPFFVWTPGIEEQGGSAERGIYVDPIYF